MAEALRTRVVMDNVVGTPGPYRLIGVTVTLTDVATAEYGEPRGANKDAPRGEPSTV